MSEFGKSINRIDARAKVTGDALFPGDYNLQGQLCMKILFSGVPHAIVKSVNTKKAEKIPGVILILTAKDVPNNEYGLIFADQPVLCGPGSNKAFADRVRFIGDQIALIVAESEESAIKARDLIDVEFEELEIVSNVEEALRENSVILHPDKGVNTFCYYRVRKGDTSNALSNSDVIVESTYHTPAQEHAYLQPEAGICYYDEEGRITVVVGGQWAHEDQEQIAHALNLPLDSIRVIYPAIGGAFGGREDMSVQIVLALAAFRLKEKGINRPVKIIWTREESIIGHHKRHPYTIKTKWGATKEGIITAAEVEIYADGGAYIYTSTKVLGNATLLCTGPYNIPNVKVDSYAIYTNNIPNGAFRGFGGPQAAFSAELQINKIAERLNIDPVEIRMKNLIKEGDLLSVGTPLPKGVTIEKAIAACAVKAGWKLDQKGQYFYPESGATQNQNYLRKGIGFACGYKNIGFSFGAPENCWAIIELYGKSEIEHAVLRHAGAEVGQGSHTVFVQMAAKALNLPMKKISLIASDTAFTLNSGSVSASRMTFMAGNAIKGAADIALEKWKNEERPAVAEFQYRPPKTTPLDPETGKSEPNFAYGYVAEAVECLVDIETGQIKLTNVICADDVGLAVNPQQVEGQIEGAIVQAAGYTLQEEFIQKKGRVLTDKFSTYLIPTVLDIPEKVVSIVLEYPDLIGPWGVRGIGEMPYLPFAPAAVSSVHNAIGIWFDEFPLTAERVFTKISQNEK
ncbi:MAG: aldehyde oxidase [Chlorobiaceae bacterium]|nr:MAG: carbon monoxide dehydrogenase molybdoprotein family protein [Chloroflexota bacterium]MBA4311009.1 aldehyde oxidase [Chlorobiaceae bacterium]